MTRFVGLEVSQNLTAICVVEETGRRLWRGQCATDPEQIERAVRGHAGEDAHVGLETGPMTPWLVHELRGRGLNIVCLDARHASAALKMQMNKTDQNDAEGLAQIMRTGWYRSVHVKSLDAHRVRALLGARAQLVGMTTRLSNHIRGVLKTFGLLPGAMRGLPFDRRVEALLADRDKRQAARSGTQPILRVAGIDDWSWIKGRSYGTLIVDLERRQVVDVLPDRSADSTARWFSQHPEIEIISRDRCGLYAQGARQGAPQARQVADRFHLLQDLRERIEQQLSRGHAIRATLSRGGGS